MQFLLATLVTLHILVPVPAPGELLGELVDSMPGTAPAQDRDYGALLSEATASLRMGYPADALAIAARISAPPGEAWVTNAAAMVAGRAHLALGEFENADKAFVSAEQTQRQGQQLLLLWYRAQSAAGAGRPDEALELLADLHKNRLAAALGPKVPELGLSSALAAGSKSAVRTWLRRVEKVRGLEQSERLSMRISARVFLGEDASHDCRTIHSQFPCAGLPAGCDAATLIATMKNRQRFERAERLMECWGYAEAAGEFELFLTKPTYRKLWNRSHFYLGEIHARKLRDDRAKAFGHYRHVFERGGRKKAYSLYQMGRCKMNLEDYEGARKLFQDYLRLFPDGEFAERCHYYKGWLPYDHDKLAAALPGFEDFLGRVKKGSLRSYILWFRAWSLYRLERFKEAASALRPLVDYGNDIVAGKAYYWLGQAALKMKETDKAADWFGKCLERYPLSYYGMLSWRKLRALKKGPADHPLFAVRLPEFTYPTLSDYHGFVPRKMLGKFGPVLDAVALGEVEAARQLFKPLTSGFERSNKGGSAAPAYRWLYSILEEPAKLRKWGAKHLRRRGRMPDDANRLSWMLEYPLPYWPLLKVAADKSGVPAYFLSSIMRQESRYRRGVISWADAVGLLQVIPKTGSETAHRLGIDFDRGRLAEPEYNIKLGASYLGLLAVDFKEQFILVAASYNAGPDPVRIFLERNGGLQLDHVIEEVAYNEARNYCRKVSGHVLKYLAIYGRPEERTKLVDKLLPGQVDFDIGRTVLY